MPKFDAGDVVEDLAWDFTRAGVKAKGIVPEPSDAAIGQFLDDLKTLYSDAKASGLDLDLPADATPDEMMTAIASVTGEAFVAFMAKLAELFATLCSGQPSTEQLLALPMRVRVKFYGWLQSEVVNPEAGTGAGTAELRALPSAAAG
jgi:hypothetical protein